MDMFENWLKHEIKDWESTGNETERVENGFLAQGMKIVWANYLYDLLKDTFHDCKFIHCYCIHDRGLTHYIDFSYDDCGIFRFYFYPQKDKLRWSITAKSKNVDIFNGDYFEMIDKKTLENVISKVESILLAIRKLHLYRIKFSVGSLVLKEIEFDYQFINSSREYELSLDHLINFS